MVTAAGKKVTIHSSVLCFLFLFSQIPIAKEKYWNKAVRARVFLCNHIAVMDELADTK